MGLTKKQQEVVNYLIEHYRLFDVPPTLDEICHALELKSRGSLHKHIKVLIAAKIVQPSDRKRIGVRLTDEFLNQEKSKQERESVDKLPFVGRIAAGKPIEALENIEYMYISDEIKTNNSCYILKVKGDSMIEAGIYDEDWVVVEQRSVARNGEVVVALVDKQEATLKFIEQYPHKTVLVPANKAMQALEYQPAQVEIQGVLVGLMRKY